MENIDYRKINYLGQFIPMELKYYCEKTRVGVKLSSMFRRNEEYFNSSIDYLTLKEYCTFFNVKITKDGLFCYKIEQL